MSVLKMWSIFYIFLYITSYTTGSVLRTQREISSDLNEEMTPHLELLEMDYMDRCSNISKARRKVLMGDRDSYENLYQALLAYGKFAHQESEQMRQIYSGKSAGDLTTRWLALENNTDALLTLEDYQKFARYQIDIDRAIYSLKVPCKDIPCDRLPCPQLETGCIRRRPYLIKILRDSRDPAVLKSTWDAAMKPLEHFGKDYNSILKLAKHDTRLTWERLAGCTPEDEGWLCGYSLIEELWDEIKPLYDKLTNFVHSRLKTIYALDDNQELLPIEYLGTFNFGDDGFLGAAKNIMPHRQLVDELQVGLDELDQEKLQVMAENVVKTTGIAHNGHMTKIIKNCLRCFLGSGELVSYCQNSISELLLPNKSVAFDVNSWLKLHENVMRANLLKAMSDSSLSSYELSLENNILYEALINLGPSLAIKRIALAGNLIPEEILLDKNGQNSMLLINALRILPKLAYYRSVDKFRLDYLQNSEKSPAEAWSETKQKEMKILDRTPTYDFLTDPNVVNNRPHLSKFLGIILHFELLERFSNEPNSLHENLKKISRESIWPAAKWQEALKDHFGIERLTTDSLLTYFQDLNNYLEETESIKQVVIPVPPRTTTTTQRITTSTTTTTSKSIVASAPVTEKPVTKKTETVKGKGSEKGENDSLSLHHSHMGAIIGALIGLFVITVIVAITLKKKYMNRRRRPKNNTNGR